MKRLINLACKTAAVSLITLYVSTANCSDISFDQSFDLKESTLSLSLQPAINSISIINQTGNNNIAANLQAGLDNQSFISQSGDSNEVIAIQAGENNYININQFGDNNQADVYQEGSHNTANIEQHGNQYFSLEQYSDFGVVNIIQF